MNQNFDENDELRPEYDFTRLILVARGKGRKQKPVTVQIDPDLAMVFPDSVAVNEGLRSLLRLKNDLLSQPN